MNKLQQLITGCKASINITINKHKDYYESVKKALEDLDDDDIDPEIYDEMVMKDTIIEIQFYPDTPIGSYTVYHFDLEKAIDQCLSILQNNNMKSHDIINEKMMALSWKQPYAELMLNGKIETRTWSAKYRGLVLICVSKKSYGTESLKVISGGHQIFRMSDFIAEENPNYEGKAIAIGRLIDCRPMEESDEDKCFVKYYPDLYCHIYENVIPIEPFEWKGTQGWKEVSSDIKSKIKFLK